MAHDEWALKYKTKGTELRNIRGKYYLYRISSKWDKKRKVSRKITHEMIGRITKEDGLIPRGAKISKAKKQNEMATAKSISAKEYGATRQLQIMNKDIISELKLYFSDDWQEIFVLATNRLLYRSPLKNMLFFYEGSFLSEQYKGLALEKNQLTKLMRELGSDREKVSRFMSKFVDGSEHLVFDITDVISQSKRMKMNAKGYNSHYNFDPQVNLFYMFATDKQMPVFYRIFPGNISGMKALKLSLQESNIKNALVIGDKGFFSEENMSMLEEEDNINFVLPLRRDSSYLDYTRLKSREYNEAFDGHFMHHGRPIFYYTAVNYRLFICDKKPKEKEFDSNEAYLFKENEEWQVSIDDITIAINNRALVEKLSKARINSQTVLVQNELSKELRNFLLKKKMRGINFDSGKKVVIFADSRLRLEEESSYLSRIDRGCEGYSMEVYKKKQLSFGTIGMITNMADSSPEKIYTNFKSRMQVETVFDTYKSLLEADRTYMQSDDSINGWVFINHIATMMYYKMLKIIKSKGLISKVSPMDVLLGLSKINKVKINDRWHLSEINSKIDKNLKQLDIHVT